MSNLNDIFEDLVFLKPKKKKWDGSMDQWLIENFSKLSEEQLAKKTGYTARFLRAQAKRLKLTK